MTERSLLVRVNMDCGPGNLAMLTPGSSLRWGRCRFEINPPIGGEADFAVVMGNTRRFDRFRCAPENTLLIVAEPPSKKIYPKGYYRQVHHLVDTHALSGHPRLTVTAPGLCWHVGLDHMSNSYRYGYDHLKALVCPVKQNKISVVCSDANSTPGQRLRLAFLKVLKRRLGDRLVHYGRGFEPIDDKMDAIGPHRFHLALENSESPNYWTEKIADAYLGWAFPFYVGCPNLADYFPSDSFVRLDPLDAEAAALRIERMLDTPPVPDELAPIAVARERVLDVYNPFAWSARWVDAFYQDAPKGVVTLRSNKAFRPFPQGMIYRMSLWK